MRNKTQSGITLIELMAVVSILGVICGLGVPGLMTLIAKNRLVTHSNDLLGALHLARSEAIKRGATVSLCKRSPARPMECDLTGREWQGGWLVFVDRNPARPTPGEILRVYETLPQGHTLSFSAPRGASLTFMANGQPIASFAGGTFRLCPPTAGAGRNILLNRAGRARVTDASCA